MPSMTWRLILQREKRYLHVWKKRIEWIIENKVCVGIRIIESIQRVEGSRIPGMQATGVVCVPIVDLCARLWALISCLRIEYQDSASALLRWMDTANACFNKSCSETGVWMQSPHGTAEAKLPRVQYQDSASALFCWIDTAKACFTKFCSARVVCLPRQYGTAKAESSEKSITGVILESRSDPSSELLLSDEPGVAEVSVSKSFNQLIFRFSGESELARILMDRTDSGMNLSLWINQKQLKRDCRVLHFLKF